MCNAFVKDIHASSCGVWLYVAVHLLVLLCKALWQAGPLCPTQVWSSSLVSACTVTFQHMNTKEYCNVIPSVTCVSVKRSWGSTRTRTGTERIVSEIAIDSPETRSQKSWIWANLATMTLQEGLATGIITNDVTEMSHEWAVKGWCNITHWDIQYEKRYHSMFLFDFLFPSLCFPPSLSLSFSLLHDNDPDHSVIIMNQIGGNVCHRRCIGRVWRASTSQRAPCCGCCNPKRVAKDSQKGWTNETWHIKNSRMGRVITCIWQHLHWADLFRLTWWVSYSCMLLPGWRSVHGTRQTESGWSSNNCASAAQVCQTMVGGSWSCCRGTVIAWPSLVERLRLAKRCTAMLYHHCKIPWWQLRVRWHTHQEHRTVLWTTRKDALTLLDWSLVIDSDQQTPCLPVGIKRGRKRSEAIVQFCFLFVIQLGDSCDEYGVGICASKAALASMGWRPLLHCMCSTSGVNFGGRRRRTLQIQVKKNQLWSAVLHAWPEA